MLTKDDLRIVTSKPRKDGSRVKKLYINVEQRISGDQIYRLKNTSFNSYCNEYLKKEVLHKAYGDLRNELTPLLYEFSKEMGWRNPELKKKLVAFYEKL